MTFAMIVTLRKRWRRTLDRSHDVGQGNFARRSGKHVAAAYPTLRMNQSRTLHSEQNLFEIWLRKRRAFGNFFD